MPFSSEFHYKSYVIIGIHNIKLLWLKAEKGEVLFTTKSQSASKVRGPVRGKLCLGIVKTK